MTTMRIATPMLQPSSERRRSRSICLAIRRVAITATSPDPGAEALPGGTLS